MFSRGVGIGTVLLLLMGTAHRAEAQIPDTTAIADSLAVPDSLVVSDTPAPTDTVRARPDSLASPARPPSGTAVTPIPAFTAALAPEEVFGYSRTWHAFAFPLTTPGAWVGTYVQNVPLASMALTLDGFPYYSVITGAPSLSLLPAEIADRFHVGGALTGSALGLATATRPLRSAHPITELRFLVGGGGAQAVSATHAQTRKAPGFLGGGSGRVAGMFHVANRRGNGSATQQQPLQHTDLVGRLGLLRPTFGIEAQFQYTDRQETGNREHLPRRTIRTDLRLSLAADVAGRRPTRLAARWSRQALRLAGVDSVSAHQASLRLDQPTGRRGAVSGWLVWDGPFRGDSLEAEARTSIGLAFSDTLLFSGNRLAATLGATRRGGTWSPVVLGRFERGAFFAEGSIGMGASWRLADSLSAERIARGAVGAVFNWENVRLALSATFSRRSNAHARVFRSDSLIRFIALNEPLSVAGATAEVGLRDRSERGLYTTAWAAVARPVGVEGELATRVAEIIPDLRGSLRVGFRAVREGTPRIKADLSATLSGWTQLTNQVVDPVTGGPAPIFDHETLFPDQIPGDAVLDLLAEVTISDRAHLFLGLYHALGSINPVQVIAGQPLLERQVRFGISWVLMD